MVGLEGNGLEGGSRGLQVAVVLQRCLARAQASMASMSCSQGAPGERRDSHFLRLSVRICWASVGWSERRSQ
jgi:hypothetical protein